MSRTTAARRSLVITGVAALGLTLLPGQALAGAPSAAAGTTSAGVSLARGTASVAAAAVRTYTVDLVLIRGRNGAKNSATLAELKAGVRNVDAFYSRTTGGVLRFKVGRTKSWTRSSIACSPTVTSRVARKLGWTGGARNLVVGYQAQSCGFVGVAYLPGRFTLLTRGAGTMAMAHEIGHNIGLSHSSLTGCSLAFTKLCSRAKDSRTADEYGDGTDLMGGAETQGSNKRFTVKPVVGTLNPLQMSTLGIPVPTTRVDLATVTDPVVVTLNARVDAGWNAMTLAWGGRTFTLTYLPGTGKPSPLLGFAPWVVPPAKGQVIVQGSLGGRSLLVTPTRRLSAGPGFGDRAKVRIGNRVLRVRVLGPTATVTVSTA